MQAQTFLIISIKELLSGHLNLYIYDIQYTHT